MHLNGEGNETTCLTEDSCQFVVTHSLHTRVALSSFSLCVFFCILVAMTAMRRTKRIYFVIKTLASMLLGMDSVSIVSCIVVVCSPSDSTIILPFWTLSVLLSYVVILIMSIERVVALYFPLQYLRWTAKETRVYFIVVLAWLIAAAAYGNIRVTTCYMKYKTISYSVCRNLVLLFLKICFIIFAAIIIICHIFIYRIIKIKRTTVTRRVTELSPKNMLRSISNGKYDSTAFSLILIMCLLLLMVAIAVLDAAAGVSDSDAWLIFACVSLTKSFFNSVCYVWWFKECRLNVFAMFSPISKRLRTKVGAMREEIFDIVSSRKETESTSAVHCVNKPVS